MIMESGQQKGPKRINNGFKIGVSSEINIDIS